MFARIGARGPVFAVAHIQENHVEELFLKHGFAPLPPPSIRTQRLYSHTSGTNAYKHSQGINFGANTPPPPKRLPAAFLFVELISLGLPENR